MFIPIDYLFIMSLVGLYLYDSAILCFYNNIFICKGIRKHFKYQCISLNFSFGKKFVLMPSLIFPYQLLFKGHWQLHNRSITNLDQDLLNIKKITQLLKPLQFINIILFIATILLLPVFIILEFSYLLLALLIFGIYLLNLLNFTYIVLKRKSLHLSKRHLFQFLLDVLFCPPFSLNILRKISLNYAIHTDSIILNQHLLQRPQYIQFLDKISQNIEVLKSNYEISDRSYTLLVQRQIELSKLKSNQE